MFKARSMSVLAHAVLAAAALLCDLTLTSYSLTVAGPALRQGGITTVRSVHFAEVIKQDLKRNNDDYKERLRSNRPALVADKSLLTLLQNNKQIKINSNRRNNDQYYEMYDFLNQPSVVDNKNSSNMATETQRLRKLSPGFNFFPILNNQSRVVSSQMPFLNVIQGMKQRHQQMITSQQTKQNKIIKLKQFMETNEKVIKQYINTKTEIPSQKSALRQLPPREHKQGQAHVDGALPDPEVLDLAPARGGRVFRHRLKGHLCHRHVLMPEGPKYDSAGHWYVPAHGGAEGGRRDYARTRAPLLLLPRCCNCCKKSALGCQ